MSKQKYIRVSTLRALKIQSWFGIFFFTAMVLAATFAHQYTAAAQLFFFVLLSSSILLFTGSVIASSDVLAHIIPLGHFEIPWQEVERVEFGQVNFVFFAGKKRLIIPNYEYWSGKEKDELLAFINERLEDRQIEVKYSLRADYLFPKHTRIG
jgi:hypothetical protein